MALSELINVLEKYRGSSPAAAPATVQEDYSKVAGAAPAPHLAAGLSEAFRSDQTPPFSQMIGALFSQSNPEQRAGILNRLLGALGPGLLSSGPLAGLSELLHSGANVTPDQASKVPPQAVEQLAEHAQKQNPSIVDAAGEFYAQHPNVVKALGAGALALILSHLSRR